MRTLHIDSPAIPTYAEQPALVPIRLTGTEGINHLYSYQITLKTTDAMQDSADIGANFDRLQFIGQPLSVSISLDSHLVQDSQSVREINGIITDITLSHRESRHYIYVLTFSPWLYLSTLRRNSRIFQDQNVLEIIETLLNGASNLGGQFHLEVTGSYPKLDYVTQFNETDFDFFSRLCQEWGINYYFTHNDGQHHLMLVDHMSTYKQCAFEQYQHIPFYEDEPDIDVEHIHYLSLKNQVTSGKFTTNDYDYKNPNTHSLYISRDNPLVDALTQQEVYSWNETTSFSQPHSSSGETIGKLLSQIHMEALRTRAFISQGKSTLRGLIPGTLFTLNHHPYSEANTKWLVTRTALTIEEAHEISQQHTDTPADQVHCEFDIFPLTEILRPQTHTHRPLTHGPQIAIVTTPDDNPIWTDELGRIKVQFLWNRHNTNSDHDSCWIRLAGPWAGNESGSMHLPRKGQEVIIDFIGGNPDRPICTGQVYNQTHHTPWLLPTQQAISGIKSAEINNSSRGNYLLMDDTEGAIQTQLGSDHLNSKLSLGKVTKIGDRINPERQEQGEGFYLETAGSGSIRGNTGILITTEYQADSNLFWSCTKTLHQFIRNALQHTHPSIAHGSYAHVNHISGDIRHALGLEAAQKELSNVNWLPDSSINVSSASGIQLVSNDSTHVSSGSMLTFSSVGHTSMAIGGALVTTVSELFSLFVKAKDYIVTTLKGKIILHAEDNQVEISAEKQVQIHSLSDNIELSADKKLLLHAKNDHITIQADKGNTVLMAAKNAHIQADEDAVMHANATLLLQALKQLKIESTQDAIIISSPKKVVINGGGSVSVWSASGISHQTSGVWKQKASMHKVDAGSSSKGKSSSKKEQKVQAAQLIAPSSKDISGKYALFDATSHLLGAVTKGKTIYYLASNCTDISGDEWVQIAKPVIQKIAKKTLKNGGVCISEIPKGITSYGEKTKESLRITGGASKALLRSTFSHNKP